MLKALKLGIIFLIILQFCGCSMMINKKDKDVFSSKSDNEILIGVAAPFAFLKEQSTGYENGLKMALDEVNKTGVLNKKIKLVKQDDESSITKGLSVAQYLSSLKGISAVIGHSNSRVSVSVAAIYEKAKVVMITPNSTSPELTQKGYKFIFRQIPSDTEIGNELAYYAQKKGYTRVAICYADDDYGRGLANSFEDKAVALGLKVVDRVTYLGSETEFQKILGRWKALDFNGIVLADNMPQAAESIKRIRQAGISTPILGGDGLDFPNDIKKLGKNAEGLVIATIYDPDLQNLQLRKFNEEYKVKYGSDPDIWALESYETLKLLASAIEKCGSDKSSDIADELRRLKGWDGLTGKLGFDENGNVQGKVIYKKNVHNGKFIYVQ